MNSTYSNLRNNFLNPPDEFSPIPFWFWNDQFDKEKIRRQIRDFKDKGVAGFLIHPRIGIPDHIRFLSAEFLDYMDTAIKEASLQNMTVFLYDEAMYPSGSAHGMVVEGEPEFASKGIRVIEHKLSDYSGIRHLEECIASLYEEKRVVSVQWVKKTDRGYMEEGHTVSLGDMTLPEAIIDGPAEMLSLLVFVDEFTGGVIRGIHYGEDDHEAGAPAYPDILNPAAVRKFINIVYDTFYQSFGKYFGNTVKGIFTDEPRPLAKRSPACYKPWTGGFLEYLKDNGFREADLPLLWYDSDNGLLHENDIRRQYERILNQRLAEVYYEPISLWCKQHNIALCGHPMKAGDIGFQKYFDIPGQDMVLRWVEPRNINALEGNESTQAKCSSDAARHSGKRRNSNECFGGFGWEFNVDEMKWIMDWLFVRGVNLLFPHAFYYSIRGDRYGERPPDVGLNNLWWPYYKRISDYIRRMCWLLTDAVNQTDVAVLCEKDYLSWQIAKPLFCNQIEFNYLQMEVLASKECIIVGSAIKIEKQIYNVLIIEDTIPIEGELGTKIAGFIANGGKVILYKTKNIPHTPKDIAYASDNVLSAGSSGELVQTVKGQISPSIRFLGTNPDLRVSGVKKEKVSFYLLINEGEATVHTSVIIPDCGCVEIWDPWKGTVESFRSSTAISRGTKNDTPVNIPISLQRRESLILAVYEDRALSCVGFCNNWVVSGLPFDIGDNVFRLWSDIEELKGFSGTAVYKNEFFISNHPADASCILDCGEAYDFLEVLINGKIADVRFWTPFIFDITDFVKEGVNQIEVRVTNSLACRYDQQVRKSGLLGPVKLSISNV